MKRRPKAAAAASPPAPAAPSAPRRVVPQNVLARRAVACCREKLHECRTPVLSAWNHMPHRGLQPPDVRQLDRMKALVSPARVDARAQGGSASPHREFYCELCRKQFATAATLETHVGTKKHKAKAREHANSSLHRQSPRPPANRCTAPSDADGEIWAPRDDDPPAVAKARQLGSKAKQLSQAGQSKKACRYSYEAARRFLLEEHSCSCAVGAAVAAAQLIEDADADIGADASPSQGIVVHKTFANLPDLHTGCSGDAELTTNTKLSCSSGMRWAGWLVLARMIYRAQSAVSKERKTIDHDGNAQEVAAPTFWRYIPEATADACYTAALQQILPWSQVCTVAKELQGPPYRADGWGEENVPHEINPAGSAAAFRSAERLCTHDVWSKLVQALPGLTPGRDSSMVSEENTMPFAPVDICRLLVTVLVEASCVTMDPSVGYTLLCLAREAVVTFGSYAEEAAILHAMAYVVRIGWAQSKGSDLYASELLLRAACAWRSSALPSSPALALRTPDGFAHSANDADVDRLLQHEHQHQHCRAIGLVDSAAAIDQAQICASLATSTALAHDDLVRAAAAVTVAKELRQHCWLLELFEARRALSYEWFECEQEAGQVPSEHQALFASVQSRIY